MIRVLFQGDSITDGNRYKDPASRWDLNHQIGHSYVFQIVGSLSRKYIGRYQFINRGVSGDNVEKITARWQRDTLDEKPDILSLLLGINGNGACDGTYPEGTEQHMHRFDTGYRQLLDAVLTQNDQTKLILIEPFVLPAGPKKNHYAEFYAAFAQKREIIHRIAEDYGAVWIPVQAELEALAQETASIFAEQGSELDPYAYWLWDGIHPTEATHNVLADLWLKGTESIFG